MWGNVEEKKVLVLKAVESLKKGDLVMVPHYFSGEEVPGRMILAVFSRKGDDGAFYARALVVLFKRSDYGSLPPLISEGYEGEQYIFDTGHYGEGSNHLFYSPDSLSYYEIYAGKEKIVKALETIPGYATHAAALKAIP